MSDGADAGLLASDAGMHACWTRIGVQGDSSCPELQQHVHCRNCPVYATGARQLLDADASSSYVAQWTAHFAQPKPERAPLTLPVVVFRVGGEWFALPTPRVTEVANLLTIHSLPHRAKGAILGVVNVRGTLLVCVSLSHMLGLAPVTANLPDTRRPARRLLVIQRGPVRVVCPVDEIHGVQTFDPLELKDVPRTVARSAASYSTAVVSWRDRSVGLLDDERLFAALQRSVA